MYLGEGGYQLKKYTHYCDNNKGFINLHFLQKMNCQKTVWNQARFSSLVKQFGNKPAPPSTWASVYSAVYSISHSTAFSPVYITVYSKVNSLVFSGAATDHWTSLSNPLLGREIIAELPWITGGQTASVSK